MWPAPQHSSSTGPSGSAESSSIAHCDWATVHGRGSSRVPSNAISSPPNEIVAKSALVEREVEDDHRAGEQVLLDDGLGDDAQVGEPLRHLREQDLQLETGERLPHAHVRTEAERHL